MLYHFLAVDAVQMTESPDEHRRHAQARADAHLQLLRDEAGAAGVNCELLHRSAEHPYEEIVKTAKEHDCGHDSGQRDSKSSNPHQNPGVGVPLT